MKSLQDLQPACKAYVQVVSLPFDYNHDFTHALLVARYAERIAREESARADVCWTAGILHEIGLAYGREDHEARGAEMARTFLSEHGASADDVARVAAAIRDSTHERVANATLEAQCLYDADQLQTVGVYGFVRVLSDRLAVLSCQLRQEAMEQLPDYQEQQFARLRTDAARCLATPGVRLMQEFYGAYREFELRGS